MAGELAVAEQNYVSVQEYLEGEKVSEVRHEYFDGEVWAMAGASDEHELVAMNFAAILHAHLKGKPCRVFMDGMKLRLPVMGSDLFYYPDVMVTTTRLQKREEHSTRNEPSPSAITSSSLRCCLAR